MMGKTGRIRVQLPICLRGFDRAQAVSVRVMVLA